VPAIDEPTLRFLIVKSAPATFGLFDGPREMIWLLPGRGLSQNTCMTPGIATGDPGDGTFKKILPAWQSYIIEEKKEA
jgi:hypothetical protein